MIANRCVLFKYADGKISLWRQCRAKFRLIKIFHSAIEATQYLISKKLTTNKYANARILEICAGHGKSAYGYI